MPLTCQHPEPGHPARPPESRYSRAAMGLPSAMDGSGCTGSTGARSSHPRLVEKLRAVVVGALRPAQRWWRSRRIRRSWSRGRKVACRRRWTTLEQVVISLRW